MARGVSFRDTGYQLSADYNQKELVTRQTALNMQLEELENIKASGLSVMTNMGNDYVLGTTDFITNMDLKGSNYTIIDETVPFYQIAIHGYVNYTGKALNLSGDYQEELLKAAEYGAVYTLFSWMQNPQNCKIHIIHSISAQIMIPGKMRCWKYIADMMQNLGKPISSVSQIMRFLMKVLPLQHMKTEQRCM